VDWDVRLQKDEMAATWAAEQRRQEECGAQDLHDHWRWQQWRTVSQPHPVQLELLDYETVLLALGEAAQQEESELAEGDDPAA